MTCSSAESQAPASSPKDPWLGPQCLCEMWRHCLKGSHQDSLPPSPQEVTAHVSRQFCASLEEDLPGTLPSCVAMLSLSHPHLCSFSFISHTRKIFQCKRGDLSPFPSSLSQCSLQKQRKVICNSGKVNIFLLFSLSHRNKDKQSKDWYPKYRRGSKGQASY